MKKITLVRHAKSDWDDPVLPDILRPLNKRGLETSLWMGHYLYQQGIHPQSIISSPASRALHTAINLSAGLKYPEEKIITESSIYHNGSKHFLDMIHNLPDNEDHVMIIGHQPDISREVEFLTGETIDNFPTCAVYTIELIASQWKNVQKSAGKILHRIIPKEVSGYPAA